MTVVERYRAVLERVARAATRAGRAAGDVSVVAVTKTFGPDAVRAVIAAGARDVGESYVQEGARKREAVDGAPVRWHLIGRLQRNKAKAAAATFDVVHSLDSLGLARALHRAMEGRGRPMPCLVQVNVAGEPSKGGVAPDAVQALLAGVAGLSGIVVEGLMMIPPPVEDAEASRRFFARLRELRDELVRLRLPDVHLKELSMGMSGDFEVAIEEGATLVRIGSAIFGPRPVKD